MSKETAFYPRLKALTDDWMDLFGYWAPLTVTDMLEEYRAVRETAGLMDFTMLRKVDLDGPGALELVNRRRHARRLEARPGHIAYGALCDEDGKMVDDCTVMRATPPATTSGSAARTTATTRSSRRSPRVRRSKSASSRTRCRTCACRDR